MCQAKSTFLSYQQIIVIIPRNIVNIMHLIITIIFFLIFSTPVFAQELHEVIKYTATNSPQIKQLLYMYKINSQAEAEAMAGFLPKISIMNTTNYTDIPYNILAPQVASQTSTALVITQPIFNGGATLAALVGANYKKKASYAEFIQKKQFILLSAIKAYLAVLTAQEVHKLNKKKERVFIEQLKNAEERLKVGESTRTEVERARSKLSAVTSDKIKAWGGLVSAQANYVHIVGIVPHDLHIPKGLPKLPSSLEKAIELAQKYSQTSKIIRNTGKVIESNVMQVSAAMLPSISLESRFINNDFKHIFTNDSTSQVKINFTIPLFQSGLEYVNLRKAKYAYSQYLYKHQDVMKTLQANITTAWNNLQTAKSIISAAEIGIKAANVALVAIKQEIGLNLNTVLALLDAEQELFKARTNLVKAKADHVLAAYQLAATITTLDNYV